jgi:adenine-specific DNA-methyltransferase
MNKSLLEQLPQIVAEGRKQAERILESLDSRNRVGLLTREWVLPAKDTKAQDWLRVDELAASRAGAGAQANADRIGSDRIGSDRIGSDRIGSDRTGAI